MKAVIMCGGAATRMRPITETVPKSLLKVAGVPVLDYIADELLGNGIEELYITLGYMAEEIINHVEKSSYAQNVTFVREDSPLGTAGGVKNAVGEENEDVIAVCGDNIFNFNIKDIIDYHKKTSSDFTIAAILSDNTSEYGVITADDDGSILRFSEKPLLGENDSQLINTGFYIVGSKSLTLIPDGKFFDFSNDLFPLLMSSELKLYCCHADGYWGDIGDFASYITVNSDMLNGNTGINQKSKAMLFTTDCKYCGASIIAPSLIEKTADIGVDCVIGPSTYIGNKCKIGDGSKIAESICLDNSSVGVMSEIISSVLCEDSSIGAYSGVGKYCAFGEGCSIENYCKIDEGTRVWPRVRIPENTRAADNIFCKPAVSSFFLSGVSGTVFNEITSTDVLNMGQAAASVKEIKKIGIASDGKRVSELLARLFSCGVLACGGSVYNFGEAFYSQASFFSSYCSLDMTVFISIDDSTANFSFTGERGLPISASILRKMRSVYKFGGYAKISPSCVSSESEMSLISDVYSSILANEIKGKPSIEFCVVSSNSILTEILENTLVSVGCKSGMNGMRIFINDEGTRMYVQDSEKVYSSQEIICACAIREFENVKSITVPEDAPEMLEKLAEKHGVNTVRIYSAAKGEYSQAAAEYYRNNRWLYDNLFLVCRFIDIMCSEKKSADEIMKSVPRFSSKKFNIDLNVNPVKLSEVLSSVGAVKNSEDVYYRINKSDSYARIRVGDRAGRLKILIEAGNSETAREFAQDITMKINKEINAINIE